MVGPPPSPCFEARRNRVANSHSSNPSGIRRLLAPVERFLAIEAASGILLMMAALAALVWANSPWRESYDALWHFPIGFAFGSVAFERDLHFWINDGLMTIFFFVVGLEIRREMHAGELSEASRAALPIAAAFGGMLIPAVIYLALNNGHPSMAGWAVPMATDIAFAVGALALLGKRVSPALRILLLALAIIDDVGAIVVIALFYSTEIVGSGFLILGLGMFSIVVLQRFGVRPPLAYIAPALLIWAGAYRGGIHPTLAGVIVGFMTPVRAVVNREAVAPAERLQHLLHGWVAFGIMPLFAFSNAGIPVGDVSFSGDALRVFLGITLGLAIGKPLGIFLLSWLAARSQLASLPQGVGLSHITIVGMVGGIGFTMALFIAQLAFAAGPLLETAKFAILVGSAIAGIAAMVIGSRILKVELRPQQTSR